jgi:hypothetical protein
VPSLDDWEKQWKKNPQGMEKPKVVAVDFQVQERGANTKTQAAGVGKLSPAGHGGLATAL